MKSERAYLQHMLEAVALIEGYIEGKSFEDLLKSPLLGDGRGAIAEIAERLKDR